MFCPNCGNECGNANFCPNCGTSLKAQNQPVEQPKKDPPKSLYQPVNVNGQVIDLFKVVCKYGVNKERAYRYLKREYGIPKAQAKELLAQYYVPMDANKPTLRNSFADLFTSETEKKRSERQRRNELEESGQVYCPKCLSTSVSANQKGFGLVRGALGAMVGLDVGMIAGSIGSKKIICTCLKCGYQWKAGKK